MKATGIEVYEEITSLSPYV